MATWAEVEREASELAALARSRFDAHRHKTIATLRADGSPRISGIEATFLGGRLLLGMMPGSQKAGDLVRDQRLALHSGSPDPDDDDPGAWPGDAKLAGRAIAIDEPETLTAMGAPDHPDGAPHLFQVDVTELVVVRVGDPPDHLTIDTWHEGRGVAHLRRT